MTASLPRKLFFRIAAPVLLTLVWIGASPANAQVSFTGAQSTVPNLNLDQPVGVALDTRGDLFIADESNNRVVELPANGGSQITIANGLNNPLGVAVDTAGDVFISDSLNNRVLELPANGGPQTTVGSGLSFPWGLAVDAAGNLFISDSNNGRVVEIPAGGGAQSTVASGLSYPRQVAVDNAGDLFIADNGHGQVVEVPAGGGAQTTVDSGLINPAGVTVDAVGNVFISDATNDDVVEIPSGGGAQLTVASGLNGPEGLVVDKAGNLFIADATNNRVVEVQTVSVNFGSVNIGASTTVTLNYFVNSPGVVTFNSPKVLTQGAPNLDFTLASGSTCAGQVGGATYCTVNVTFTPKFAGTRNGALQIVGGDGTVLATTFIYGVGVGPQIAFGPGVQSTISASGLKHPYGMAVNGAGDLFIADFGNSRVVEVPAGGGPQTTVGSGLYGPYGVAVDGAGNLFIADSLNNRVVEIPAGGGAQTTVGSGLFQPLGLALDGARNLFVADSRNRRVVEIPAGGGAQTTVGSGLNTPVGVAVDGAGDVFITDSPNNNVIEVPAGGGSQTTVGSALNGPLGVAVDAAGDVFIADTNNNRVVEVPAGGGPQTTVAASGLGNTTGVTLDSAGDLFIADWSNNRIVEVNRSQPPTLSFAPTNVNSTSSDSPQLVTIDNIGNATLFAIAPGLNIGANFEQVAGSGTPADCTNTFSLAPGGDCNLSISFTPKTSGAIQSSAVLTDNALNGSPATQTISLAGTGIALAQTITFNPIPPQVQNTTLTLVASASSNLPVAFTSLTPGICTVSGTSAMLNNPGTCTIQASQPANHQYAPAASVMQSFTVTPAANFTITPIPPAETVYRERLGGVILKLQSVDGFNANVTLSCSGGPAGSVCADLPQTVHVNGTAYAISGVLFPKRTTPGTYIITFTGVSGSLTNSTTAKFVVK